MQNLPLKQQPYDTEVLEFWARQAQLQRAAMDAFAAYLYTSANR
ncbi:MULTISPECIES: hypothetical protein [Halomonadaceae]|nr:MULTISPECIES: hypothetical protein [Halomonas]